MMGFGMGSQTPREMPSQGMMLRQAPRWVCIGMNQAPDVEVMLGRPRTCVRFLLLLLCIFKSTVSPQVNGCFKARSEAFQINHIIGCVWLTQKVFKKTMDSHLEITQFNSRWCMLISLLSLLSLPFSSPLLFSLPPLPSPAFLPSFLSLPFHDHPLLSLLMQSFTPWSSLCSLVISLALCPEH